MKQQIGRPGVRVNVPVRQQIGRPGVGVNVPVRQQIGRPGVSWVRNEKAEEENTKPFIMNTKSEGNLVH